MLSINEVNAENNEAIVEAQGMWEEKLNIQHSNWETKEEYVQYTAIMAYLNDAVADFNAMLSDGVSFKVAFKECTRRLYNDIDTHLNG